MGYKIEQETFDCLPVGDYPALINEIELVDGQFGEQLKFSFALQGEHQGRTLLGWASAKFSPRSKLYSWTRAAFGGRGIPMDYNLDTDHLLGKMVTLTVLTRRKQDGTEFNKIDEVKPYRNGNGRAPAEAEKPERSHVQQIVDEIPGFEPEPF